MRSLGLKTGVFLTIMVVEDVGVADSDHALPAGGIGDAVGAVDNLATAVRQVLA